MAIFRGNTVFFDIQFLDQDKAAMSVDTATLTVLYSDGGCDTEASVTLTEGDEEHWQGEWNSEVADEGWVHWVAVGTRSSDGKQAAGGGKLKIVTNPAAEKVFEDD